MTNILKFQTKQDKAKAERLSLTFHVQTDILDDGSVWYRFGTKADDEKNINWGDWATTNEIIVKSKLVNILNFEWRKVDE